MGTYHNFGRKLYTVDNHGVVAFMCPGCKHQHLVRVAALEGFPNRPVWDFNQNPDTPTFSPSYLLTSHTWSPPVTPKNLSEWRAAPWPQVKVPKVCHSFITDGKIQFLDDCTHELAGQTVELPDQDKLC